MQRFFRRLFAQSHIFIYRTTGGLLGHRLIIARTLLLTTTGRKTGQPRVTPLAYFADGDTYIIVASNYGSATYPLWWRNLQAQPEAAIQVGRRRMRVLASRADAATEERLWPVIGRSLRTFAYYRRTAKRDIPLIVLRPMA
jgi:deazaflavin-dependent oxidoreductase (nitroreductase family)